MAKTRVLISKFAEKQLKRLPIFIQELLFVWVSSVERIGIREVRRLSGYHDEPLKGKRQKQRSVRLNRAYRVFYEEQVDEILILILEVNKHDY